MVTKMVPILLQHSGCVYAVACSPSDPGRPHSPKLVMFSCLQNTFS